MPWPQIIIHDYTVSPNHMGPQLPNTERGWVHPSSEMGPHECPGQALRRDRKMCEVPGEGGRVRFWRPWCPGGRSLSLPSRGSSWESSPEARLSPDVQAPGFPLCLLLPLSTQNCESTPGLGVGPPRTGKSQEPQGGPATVVGSVGAAEGQGNGFTSISPPRKWSRPGFQGLPLLSPQGPTNPAKR